MHLTFVLLTAVCVYFTEVCINFNTIKKDF